MQEDTSYVKWIPPPPLPGKKGTEVGSFALHFAVLKLLPSKPLQIEVTLNLQQVVDLSELDYRVTLQFELGLTWTDRGLTFLNLRTGEGGVNRLSHEDKALIWKPKVRRSPLPADFGKAVIWRAFFLDPD